MEGLFMREIAKDRRQFLCHALTSAAALAGMSAAKANAQDFPKSDKASAGYQDNAKNQTCSECTLFLPPDQCKVVQGPISENGTCNYFTQ
jgi:hypothetical protein